jgi:DNA-binding LytR/AlgR family response regulator
MLKIGICDESADDAACTEKIVRETFRDMEEICLEVYPSGEKLLDAILQETFDCNLLLLEVLLRPRSGTDIISILRKRNIDTDVIFVTNSTEEVYQGYVCKAFAYVLKSRMTEELPSVLCRYYQEISKSEGCLNITSDGVMRQIAIEQIIYLESNARLITVHLAEETISFYAKMSEMESILAERGYMRTHQSYMVRSSLVTDIEREFVTLCGNIKIPVSRKYYPGIRKRFMT